ncbi:MAG: DNA-processing protein DprA [Nitrospira sp.]|nr:DNA-processing protein DprA [Nitrospira sp.]
MDQESLAAWLTLQATEGIGDRTLIKLVQRFGSPQAVLAADVAQLIGAGCSKTVAESLRRDPTLDHRRAIDRQCAIIERLNIRVCSFMDPAYPARLKAIADPPPLLYVTGDWPMSVEAAVAIVGSRRATPSGRIVTERIAQELAARGVVIVSGLARGIDAAAHCGALAGKGRTIAVLGCGIDRTYPSEHRGLRRRIEEAGGAVVSELPVGTPPLAHHFPRRNRIISGLSLGVLVSEATKDSGSLITATLALEQGREVFAVPGPVTSEAYQGSNGLIKEGAKLVESAQDIVDEILPQIDTSLLKPLTRGHGSAVSDESLDKDDAAVYEVLSAEAQSVDVVIERTGLAAATVVASLLTLELSGRIRQLPGQQYVRL